MNGGQAEQAVAKMAGGLIQNPSITERLEAERNVLEDRLTQVKKALAALQSKPELMALLDIVSKTTGRY